MGQVNFCHHGEAGIQWYLDSAYIIFLAQVIADCQKTILAALQELGGAGKVNCIDALFILGVEGVVQKTSHLVAVEVGIIGHTDQGVDLDGPAFYQYRFKGLDFLY